MFISIIGNWPVPFFGTVKMGKIAKKYALAIAFPPKSRTPIN